MEGITQVRIDKDLIGNPGGRKRVERDNRSRKTKRRVRKANSVFDAGCNERATEGRKETRLESLTPRCNFHSLLHCVQKWNHHELNPRNFQFAPLCIRPGNVSSARGK